MHYREFAPSAPSRPLVDAYWHLRGSGNGRWESIYPDSCGEILFNLGRPADERREPRIERQPRHLVYGQIEERILVRSASDTDVLGIRLLPWAASAILRVPADELAGGAIAFDSIAPELARRLIAIVEDSKPVPARILELDSYLIRWARRKGVEVPATGRVARHLQRRPSARPSDISRLTGWSPRTGQRRFRAELGLGPKRFQQITRFLRFLRRLDLEPDAPTAELAVAAGYYDQPHLHRDLRRFTGETPAAFRARRRGTFDPLYSSERLGRLVSL